MIERARTDRPITVAAAPSRAWVAAGGQVRGGQRGLIVVVMTALYFKTRDPLFLVLDAIVLIGLLPSIYVAAQSAHASKGV
jgi:hypothetical protein